jgi:hypothetical protein
VTEIAASRKRLAQANTRRAMHQLRAGDTVTGPDSLAGHVVAVEQDSEGDPLVILADSRGRRRVITLESARQLDVTLRTTHTRDLDPDMSCGAADVAL